MSDLVGRLQTLTYKQRNLIIKLERENQQLKLQNRALSRRVQDLEETHVVIDREIAEIPIGLDLIPENDLNR